MSTADVAMPAAAASVSAVSAAAAAAPAEPLVHIYTQNIAAQLTPAGSRPTSGALPTADRLAAPNTDTVFLACGRQLHLLQPIVPENPVIRLGRQGPYSSDFIPLQSAVTPISQHAHISEVQNVCARSVAGQTDRYIVASVDSFGIGKVSHLHITSTARETAARDAVVPRAAFSQAPFTLESSWTLAPPRAVEDGWHGISLHPVHDDRFTVASSSGKSLSMYQGERLVQTLFTHAAPTSFKYMQAPQFNEPLLVCNEGSTLSVWDLRLSNALGQVDNVSRGAIQRLQDTTGDLFALDTHSEAGLVATGGVDKQVTVYDSRKWQVAGRWKNVLKYEIMSVQFTAFSPSYIYVTGMDHEVYCGHWNNQALNQRNLERLAFRGDARWVGLARTTDAASTGRGGDQVVGLTASAQLYILRNAHLQSGPLDATGTATSAASAQMTLAKQRKEELAQERRDRVASGQSADTEEEQLKKQQQRERKADNARKRKAQQDGAEQDQTNGQHNDTIAEPAQKKGK